MAGSRPKPGHIKLVTGNPGGRPLNKDEALPDVSPDTPPAPEYLSAEAAKVWDDTARKLYKCGLLTTVDEDALALYCTTFARWLWAEKKLQAPPETVYTMTPHAEGISRDVYIAKGWTDDNLVKHGYMLEPEVVEAQLMKTKSGYVAHSPYLAIANKCFDQLKSMLIEFGMTPSARTRVKAEVPKDNDKMGDFLELRK